MSETVATAPSSEAELMRGRNARREDFTAEVYRLIGDPQPTTSAGVRSHILPDGRTVVSQVDQYGLAMIGLYELPQFVPGPDGKERKIIQGKEYACDVRGPRPSKSEAISVSAALYIRRQNDAGAFTEPDEDREFRARIENDAAQGPIGEYTPETHRTLMELLGRIAVFEMPKGGGEGAVKPLRSV